MDVCVSVCYDKLEQKLANMLRDSNCSLHLPDLISFDSAVLSHGAVVAQSGDLTNKGDFVKTTHSEVSVMSAHNYYHKHNYCSHTVQVALGVLLACVRVTSSNTEICIIRKLQPLTTPSGDPKVNNFDCPLLHMTAQLYGVSPSTIIKSVSVVHECADSCKIDEGSYAQCELERETISRRNIMLFKHDFSNDLFCYNIFCTANNP